jgi:hypothetical protein
MWGGGGGQYDIWATFLERWAAGEDVDASGLPLLPPEAFTGDTWERLLNRINQAISRRLRLWAEALARAMNTAGDEFGVARALTQARDGLRRIRVLAAHPHLPPDLTTRLADLVDAQIRASQEAIERSVETMRRSGADRAAVEARLRTVRENSLLAVVSGPAAMPAWAVDPSAPSRRRVIHT